MKVVRHEKRRGKYMGLKNGIDGEYECSVKQREKFSACSTGSTHSMCHLCPFHKPCLSEANPIDPAVFSPEVINEILKSGLFREDSPGCGSDTTVIVFGNVVIFNRNAACQRVSSENTSMQ